MFQADILIEKHFCSRKIEFRKISLGLFTNLKFTRMKFFRLVTLLMPIVSGALFLTAEPNFGPEPDPNFHVFILLGQSNMEGGQSVDGEMDKEKDNRIYKMNKQGDWIVASDPITNNYDVAVGPGFQFAKKMIEENPEISIGLIPLAVGGKELNYWNILGTPYRDVIFFANEANKSGVLKGILWHQGEGDTGDPWNANTYGRKLINLVDHIRKDLHNAYLPFVVGGLTQARHPEIKDLLDLRTEVNDQLKFVGHSFFQTGYVSSEKVPYMDSDPVHFTSEGQRTMGERYATEYLRISGFWTAKGKDWLDSGITDEVDHWKFHPDLGAYYDEFWPVIKHAQLGWGELEIDQDHAMKLTSPFLGTFQILHNDQNEQIINIAEVVDDSDPDHPSYGSPHAVFIHRDLGSPYVFYDYQTESYIDRLPLMTLIEDTWDMDELMQASFRKAQESARDLRLEIASDTRLWGIMRKWVDQVVFYRNLTNHIGWEGYHFAVDNESGNLKTFWKEYFLRRLHEIDEVTGQAQADYQAGENQILSNN